MSEYWGVSLLDPQPRSLDIVLSAVEIVDYDRFSHRQISITKRQADLPPLIPLMLDPPEHTPFRRIVMQMFAPRKLDVLESRARELAIDLVEGIKARGDVAADLPVSEIGSGNVTDPIGPRL